MVTSLPTRRLGARLSTSALGLGCMGMSQSYGPADEQESVATLHRALDLGCTLLDTAESYGPFTNEELLGRALRGRRDEAVLATKFGFAIDADGTRHGLDSRPEHIREVLHASLRRLGTDHVDVLYQHRVDPDVPIEDVAGTVGELVEEGVVRHFGLSEAAAETIRRAHAVTPVSVVQTEYSLWERGVERAVLPALRELDIGLVAYSPLGRGFLTGSARRAEDYPADDYRRNDPRFQGDHFDANTAAAQVVAQLAERLDATPAQVALAWLLSRGEDVVAIPGTKRRTTLEENLAAADLELSAADLEVLDGAMGATAGTRYPEEAMHLNER